MLVLDANTREIQGALNFSTSQNVTINANAVATSSAAFSQKTRMVRVVSNTACYIATLGTNQQTGSFVSTAVAFSNTTVSTFSSYLPANTPEWVQVPAQGSKMGVVTASGTAGFLNITELY